MSDEKKRDGSKLSSRAIAEEMRSDYVYKPWPKDRLTREAQQMSQGGKITEIPISEEILRESAARVIANPPKFPLLKGEEGRQIIRRLVELTEKDYIIWEITLRKIFEAFAFYRGLELKFLSMASIDSGRRLSSVISISTKEKFTSFNSSFYPELLGELEDAILKQRERNKESGPTPKTFLEIIWDILN
ncbi:MAG: hypothetical protein Q8Q89_00280 [bacterium]|nr:hypothetical protein [bacterium]